MNTELSVFEEKTGIVFTNKKLLTEAFTHRSYINENPRTGMAHNERLEFLGDAVLELIVTDYLFRTYPTRDEGELTAFRAALVNAVTIAEIATMLEMNDYLLLSRGEAKDTGGKARMYILANTYEAYLGAVFLDRGYETAKQFVTDTLLPRLAEIVEKKLWIDAKSLVQEKAQEIFSVTPSYKVLSESGPDHDKQFTIGIFFGKDEIARGKGKSKQEAEQEAARGAIEKNNW